MPRKSALDLLASLDASREAVDSHDRPAQTPKPAVKSRTRKRSSPVAAASRNDSRAAVDLRGGDDSYLARGPVESLETHMLLSCASCHAPKNCPVEFFPYCSVTCQRKGSR